MLLQILIQHQFLAAFHMFLGSIAFDFVGRCSYIRFLHVLYALCGYVLLGLARELPVVSLSFRPACLELKVSCRELEESSLRAHGESPGLPARVHDAGDVPLWRIFRHLTTLSIDNQVMSRQFVYLIMLGESLLKIDYRNY
jgi:hypothetical protein